MSKFTKHNYLFSILRTMLLSGIIPLIILGFLSYQSSSKALEKKVSQVNFQLLLQTRMRFEQTMDIIYNYYVLLGNDRQIYDYLDSSLSYSDVTIVPLIQNKLLQIQNLQPIVSSSTLVNLKERWVIFHDQFQDYINHDLRNYIKGRMKEEPNIFWTFEEKRGNTISLFIKLPYNSQDHDAVLKVDLDQNKIKEYFLDETYKKMLVIDDEGYIIHFHDIDKIGQESDEILGNLYANELKKTSGTFTYIDMEGKLQGAIYEKSPYNNWTYFILYDIKALNKDISGIRNLTYLMVGALVLALIIVVVWSANRLYSPVGNIYNRFKEQLDYDEESNHLDEINYIDKGIDNLFNERLNTQLEMALQKIKVEELFLIKLIRGELSDVYIKDRTVKLGKINDFANFSVVCFQITKLTKKKQSSREENIYTSLLLKAIRSEIDSELYLSPILRNDVVVVLIDSHEEDISAFREQLFVLVEQLQSKLENSLDVSIAVGISNVFSEVHFTEIAFKESLEAIMSNSHLDEKNSIHFSEDIDDEKKIRTVYPSKMVDELILWINKGNIEKAKNIVGKVIDSIFKSHVGYNEHMLHVSQLLIEIINVIQSSGVPLNTIIEKTNNPMEHLMALTDVNQIKEWFCNMLIEPIIPILVEQRSDRNQSLIQEIRKMVEEEYNKDLSLEICADRLNYHPSYIWKIMKQEMGISFSVYLLEYRLEKAKQMLIDSNDSIGVIAEKLCYNNAQNFIRYFKKRVGITPGAYRKEQMK